MQSETGATTAELKSPPRKKGRYEASSKIAFGQPRHSILTALQVILILSLHILQVVLRHPFPKPQEGLGG